MSAARRKIGLLLGLLACLLALPPAAAALPTLPIDLPQHRLQAIDLAALQATLREPIPPASPPLEVEPRPSPFSLSPPAPAIYRQLFERDYGVAPVLARGLESMSADLPSLTETRLKAFALFDTDSPPKANRVSRGNATRFGLGLAEKCGGPFEMFLSEDPAGDVDSPSLYAYVGNAPNMGTDPMGLFEGAELRQNAQIRGWLSSPDMGVAERQAGRDAAMQVLANPYVQGGLQVGAGCLEAGLGIAGIAASPATFGSSGIAGMVMVAHGSDLCGTGFVTWAGGETQDTLFVRGARGGFVGMGMDPYYANWAATGLDIGVGVGASAWLSHSLARAPAGARAFRVGEVLPNGRIAGLGPGAALRDSPEFAALLSGEGEVGEFKKLLRAGRRGDDLTPHHMPPDAYMAGKGIPGYTRDTGIAMNMEMPHPGVGGRHRLTLSYGGTPNLSLTPRQALAAEVWDVRGIYMDQGLYTSEIRKSLRAAIKLNRQKWPGYF